MWMFGKPWSPRDIGCGLALFVVFAGFTMVCLAPVSGPSLDNAYVEANRIPLVKLAQALDAHVLDAATPLPASPADLPRGIVPDGTTDVWGNALLFFPACTAGRWSYRLLSLGQDGKPGGDALNADLEYDGPRPADLVVACPR
ncbi:MAG: type II secretion system protein GspG [Myxococcota bacterium]